MKEIRFNGTPVSGISSLLSSNLLPKLGWEFGEEDFELGEGRRSLDDAVQGDLGMDLLSRPALLPVDDPVDVLAAVETEEKQNNSKAPDKTEENRF